MELILQVVRSDTPETTQRAGQEADDCCPPFDGTSRAAPRHGGTSRTYSSEPWLVRIAPDPMVSVPVGDVLPGRPLDTVRVPPLLTSIHAPASFSVAAL